MDSAVNQYLLEHNTCFGCGPENPTGLQIEIFTDDERADMLRARFLPRPGMAGFPGIVHGGAIFTALDCLSTWVAILTGPNRTAAWVLRSAETVYHRPAPVDRPLELTGWIDEHGGPWEPAFVELRAAREDGEICVEGRFKVVPLSKERLAAMAGLAHLPENWQAFLGAPSE